MSDRVPSDHPTVDTYRGTLSRSGGTRRPAVELPDEAGDCLSEGETIRLVLDGTERHAPVDRTHDGRPILRSAYDSPGLAREREGPNRLVEWANESDLDFGRTVLFDVVVEDFRYGLRTPGEETVYDASRPPSSDLQDIAGNLED